MNNIIDDFEPFESAKLLISEANDSIPEFERRCETFNRTCGAAIVQEHDRKTGDDVIKVTIAKRIEPSLRSSATRVLADLRHALDQAMCDAAVELGRKSRAGVHFPTSIDASEFEGQKKRCLKGVDVDIVTFIDSFHPYKGGHGELIWALSRLVGEGKHQRPIPLGPGVNQNYDLNNGSLGGPSRIGYNQWRPGTREFEIARIEPGGHLHGNLTATPQVVIEYPVSRRYYCAPHLMRDISRIVERVVLGIEAETARILTSRS